ncbi:MAG: PIN domain-containing protein [Cyclobacteriaceae bacterium]|nr:PIN domain-containing protein [Cyclobacteriaceae bacterium SS2]
MDKILIDTDVILDFFFDRNPFAEYASQVFSLCENNLIKGYTTPVIYSNVYYLLRQTASHEKVIDHLKQLSTITDILSMDKEVVINSLNSGFKDFEEGLQNFATVKYGKINVILTRNFKDFKKSEIGIMTPEFYIKSTTNL